jgi:peptidoglycan/LPS O-acetylase OafA/YrhL
MKLNQITFTRFIAAVAILIFHFAKGIYPFNNPHISLLTNHTNLGVSYFFTLSGFVMIIAYNKNPTINTSKYYLARFVRIYPLYFLALLVSLLLSVEKFDLTGFLLQALLIHSWFPAHIMNYNIAAWSLSVELLFYLLFPLLFNQIYKKFSLKSTFIIIFPFWIISMVALTILSHSGFITRSANNLNFIFYSPVVHLNEFLLGNIGGLFFTSITKNYKFIEKDISLVLITLLSGAVLFLLIKAFRLTKNDLQVLLHDGLLGIIFIPFIILLSLNRGFANKIFSWKPLIFLGEISYGMYILQFPVYKLWLDLCQKSNLSNPLLIFVSFVGFLIAICSVLYLYVEKPLNKWVRKKTKQGQMQLTHQKNVP